MPSLPLVTRTGLIDKRRGSKAHTAISEVHVGLASSTGMGPSLQVSLPCCTVWSWLRKTCKTSGNFAVLFPVHHHAKLAQASLAAPLKRCSARSSRRDAAVVVVKAQQSRFSRGSCHPTWQPPQTAAGETFGSTWIHGLNRLLVASGTLRTGQSRRGLSALRCSKGAGLP